MPWLLGQAAVTASPVTAARALCLGRHTRAVGPATGRHAGAVGPATGRHTRAVGPAMGRRAGAVGRVSLALVCRFCTAYAAKGRCSKLMARLPLGGFVEEFGVLFSRSFMKNSSYPKLPSLGASWWLQRNELIPLLWFDLCF